MLKCEAEYRMRLYQPQEEPLHNCYILSAQNCKYVRFICNQIHTYRTSTEKQYDKHYLTRDKHHDTHYLSRDKHYDTHYLTRDNINKHLDNIEITFVIYTQDHTHTR